MPMEEWVKCLSPQNTFGVLMVTSVAAKSNTIEVNGDHFFKRNKTTQQNIACLGWHHTSSMEAFQVFFQFFMLEELVTIHLMVFLELRKCSPTSPSA